MDTGMVLFLQAIGRWFNGENEVSAGYRFCCRDGLIGYFTFALYSWFCGDVFVDAFVIRRFCVWIVLTGFPALIRATIFL